MNRETVLWIIFDACLVTWMFSGCGTAPTPQPDPVPFVDYSAVCQHLADMGCPEGKAPECAVAFGRFQGGRLSDLQPSCLMAAKAATEARACGSVLCEQP